MACLKFTFTLGRGVSLLITSLNRLACKLSLKSREGSGQQDIYNVQFYNLWYRIQRRKEKFRDTSKENRQCQKSLSAEFCATGFLRSLRKTANILRATTGFPAQWRCLMNERGNSILVTCHCPDLGSTFWLVVPRGKFALTNQKHYSDVGSDASSVWNFSVRSAGKTVLASWSVSQCVNVSSFRNRFQVSYLHWSWIAKLCCDQLKIISRHFWTTQKYGKSLAWTGANVCLPQSADL